MKWLHIFLKARKSNSFFFSMSITPPFFSDPFIFWFSDFCVSVSLVSKLEFKQSWSHRNDSAFPEAVPASSSHWSCCFPFDETIRVFFFIVVVYLDESFCSLVSYKSKVFSRHESLTSLLQVSSLTCLLVFPYQDLQFYSHSSDLFHSLQTSVFAFYFIYFFVCLVGFVSFGMLLDKYFYHQNFFFF